MKSNLVKIHNVKKDEIIKSKIKSIMFVIIVLLLLIGVFLILYFKIIKHFTKDIISENPPISPIYISKDNDVVLNSTYKDPLESPLQNIISGLSYEEIELKINYPIIFENNILLNDTINNINDNILLNDSGIDIISNISEIAYSPPDFLISPTNNSLKIVKSDIAFYKSKFEELSIYIYNYSINASESLNNIYYLLNDTKEELINLLNLFEDIFKLHLTTPCDSEPYRKF